MGVTMKVEITQDTIDHAVRRDSRTCMIAEAIKATKPVTKVTVDLATIRWTDPKRRKRYICITPEPAARALVAFDRGEDVEPFTLNLRAIQVTTIADRVTREDGTTGDRQVRGRKKMSSDGETIKGGKPIAAGHLSNVKKSGRHRRQYGRRQLAD